MSYISDVREGWCDWTSSFEWNICGTLTFSVNQKPSLTEAQRYWSSFWHKIDQLCYGRSYKNHYHVPRFVYTHQGSGGENPHIHFLAFTPCDTREFCILLNAIWAGMTNAGAAVPHQNEILPVRSKEAASRYLQHEDRCGDVHVAAAAAPCGSTPHVSETPSGRASVRKCRRGLPSDIGPEASSRYS